MWESMKILRPKEITQQAENTFSDKNGAGKRAQRMGSTVGGLVTLECCEILIKNNYKSTWLLSER